MHLGIVGPAQSGKSTLFCAATGQPQDAGHGAHRGIVKVPDARLDRLAEIEKPRKITPAEVDYLDWGGVATDPSQAADLESKIPSDLRAADALVAVIRAFASDVVPHPKGSVDPGRDITDLQLALALADLATVEKRMERIERTLKVKKYAELEAERGALSACQKALEAEQPLRELELPPEEWQRLRGFGFLSAKPLLIVVNIAEEDIAEADAIESRWRSEVAGKKSAVIALSAQIEMEVAQLPPAEREVFLQELGITEPALGRMIRASQDLLGYISFFTAGDPEVRAWNVRRGSPAVEAAAAIHSDIARGFIRAEVVTYEDYVTHGGIPGAKKAGRFRLEGKDYIVQDGDVIYFRFNV